jgi:Skp family chaperone for outer membrane proteins
MRYPRLFVICTLVLAVVVGGAMSLAPSDPAMTATFLDTEPQAHPADLEQLRADLAALQRELQAVRVAQSSDTTAELRDLRTKLAQLQQQLDSSATRESASAASQGEAALESPEAAEQQEREHTRQLVAFLNGQFQSEAIDTQWGTQAEAQITDTFSLEALRASRLRSVRCQATMCQVEVDHINTDAERAFMTQLGKLEAFVNAEAFYERTDHDNGSVAVRIYVARSGHRLPEPPEPL